jgi:hypothetical protein
MEARGACRTHARSVFMMLLFVSCLFDLVVILFVLCPRYLFLTPCLSVHLMYILHPYPEISGTPIPIRILTFARRFSSAADDTGFPRAQTRCRSCVFGAQRCRR